MLLDTRTLPVPALEEDINRVITALHNEEWIVQDAATLDLAKTGSKAYLVSQTVGMDNTPDSRITGNLAKALHRCVS